MSRHQDSDEGLPSIVTEKNLAFIRRRRRKTWFQHAFFTAPKSGCLIVAGYSYLCCIVFILLNTVYRGNGEQETSKEEASKEEKEYHGEDDFFPEELEMAEAYSQWELAERTTQAAVTTAMVCGVCAHAGSFLFPFLLWTPVQAAVNLIMMAAAVRREDKTCLVLGMLLCFDVYGWGVVYSARQQMNLDDILDAKFDSYIKSFSRRPKSEREVSDNLDSRGRKVGRRIKRVLRTTKRNIQ